MTDSNLIGKGPCDDCGSSDACGTYDDGHSHCYACGVHHNGEHSAVTTPATRQPSPLIDANNVANLTNRNLSAATVSRWGVALGYDPLLKTPVLVLPYRDASGNIVAQKVRTPSKDFRVTGDLKDAKLFGQHLARTSSKFCVVTEGEIDAMSVDEALATGSYHPAVVSVPNGAQGAKKAILNNLEWLSTFEKVVICFDMDEPGRKAADECVAVFPPGKAAIAVLPEKDANDMLKAGKRDALKSAIFDAEPHRPDGIVTVAEIAEAASELPTFGFPWFVDDLNKRIYGRRYGELVTVGAGTGVGKSTFCFQQAHADLTNGLHVGLFAFENSAHDALRRIAGIGAKKMLHTPDCGATKADIASAIAAVDALPGKLYLYNSLGVAEFQTISNLIRYLNKAFGVRVFYVDNLTGLAGEAGEQERAALEGIMRGLASLKSELNVWIGLVSHLSRSKEGAHEEGARITINHFRGTAAIGFHSDVMIGLERDQQADDGEASTTTLRVLKDRYTGRASGFTTELTYDQTTGLLIPHVGGAASLATDDGDF